MNGKPHCHLFRHEDRDYVYDVGSSEVFHVDRLTSEVLARWTGTNDEEVVDALSPRHGSGSIRSTLQEIREARVEQGLFLPMGGSEIEFCRQCFNPERYESELSHLTLSVTEQCNLRCRYCPHSCDLGWVRSHGSRRMSIETALSALDFFLPRSRAAEIRAVSFYGGEPLLAFDVIKACVERIRKEGDASEIVVQVDTNATVLDEEMVEFLVREKIRLQISLDGPRAIHDRHRVHRDGQGSYDDVVRGIGMLLDADPDVVERITYIATAAPPYDFPAVVEFFDALPFYVERGIAVRPSVRLNLADLHGQGIDRLGADEREAVDYRRQYATMRERYQQQMIEGQHDQLSPALQGLFDEGLIKYFHRPTGPTPAKRTPGGFCTPGVRRLHVRANGEYQPCERVADALVIGDVERGIDRAAIGHLLESIAKDNREKCKRCWATRLCGICFTAFRAEPGEIASQPSWEVPESECDAMRFSKEETLRLVVSLTGSGSRADEFFKGTTIS